MKIYLTNGMGGKAITVIGEVDNKEDAFQMIEKWKQDVDNQKKYKIEPYSRFMSSDKDEIYVDFGDYSTFITISGLTFDDMIKVKE